MSSMSPTQRTLAELRRRGYVAQVVEKWNQYSRTRQDLFGGIDIVAIHPELGILGVQACAGASHAARRDKLIAEPKLVTWCYAGAQLAVWSWAKRGARGKPKLWTLRDEQLVVRDGVLEPAGVMFTDHEDDA